MHVIVPICRALNSLRHWIFSPNPVFQLYGVINQYMSYESNQKSCLTEILAMEMARNLFQSFSFSLFGTQVAQLNHGPFNNRYNFILQQPLSRMKMDRMSAPAC